MASGSARSNMSAPIWRAPRWGADGEFHQRYDLLLTPMMPVPALPIGKDLNDPAAENMWIDWSPFSYPFNMTRQPAASVPCGLTGAGLPIGLHIVGRSTPRTACCAPPAPSSRPSRYGARSWTDRLRFQEHANDRYLRQNRDRHRRRLGHRARHRHRAGRGRRQCRHGRHSEGRGRAGGARPVRHQQAGDAGADRCDPGAIGARRAGRGRAQFRQIAYRLQQCRRADARHHAWPTCRRTTGNS